MAKINEITITQNQFDKAVSVTKEKYSSISQQYEIAGIEKRYDEDGNLLPLPEHTDQQWLDAYAKYAIKRGVIDIISAKNRKEAQQGEF